MAAGVTGLHGNHAVLRAEGDTEHALARAPIHRPNGAEKTALERTPPMSPAICTNVKVEGFVIIIVIFWLEKYYKIIQVTG